jgi:hypothetical protein
LQAYAIKVEELDVKQSSNVQVSDTTGDAMKYKSPLTTGLFLFQ